MTNKEKVLKHWNEILEQASKADWPVHKYSLESKDCAWCQEYEGVCAAGCPLYTEDYHCHYEDSPYHQVADFTDNGFVLINKKQDDFIKAIKYMIKCIEECEDD